jgi:hypothetical protein
VTRPDEVPQGRRLRVGYVVDEGRQPWLVQQLVERGRGAAHYEPAVLLQVRKPLKRPWQFAPLAALARGSLTLLARTEYIIVARMTGFAGFFRTVPAEALGLPVQAVSAAAIREHAVDVLVHAASAPPPDDAVIASAPFGLLLPVTGSPPGSGPPGFHEVRRREPRTPYAIRHLGGSPQTVRTVFRGALNTAPLWTRNAVDVTRKLAAFIHLLLERAGRDGAMESVADPVAAAWIPEDRVGRVPPRSTVPTGRHSAHWIGMDTPGLAAQAACLAGTLLHGMERTFRRALGARWRWSVAYQFTDSWKDAVLSRSRVITNPPNRFFADPCVVRWQGRHICFVEDFDYRTSRARISAMELRHDGYELLGPALEEPFHLSHPYIFVADGELYMCPETAEIREIRLYRCTRFPLAWTLHAVLMRDVAAVDTSILFHGGGWWMLTNVDSAGIGEYRSELHVFRADRFDAVSWQPHPRNPVIADSARARNGGLILQGGEVFRVFQVHGFDVYGQSMGVAKVTLSEDDYQEEVVAHFEPDFLEGIAGAHSLTYHEGVLAVDFVRRERPDR